METRSEKITNLVNNNYFFKEFCYYNTQIANEKHTEIELADLLITFDDSLLVFQLKERDHSAVIDEESEAKWFQKKVLKKAKKQTVRTIEYLEEYKDTQLLNNKGHKIVLDINDYPNVFNIIIFDEDDKLEDRYRNQKGVISSRVGYIHLLSLNAYEIVCKYLHTPVEILEYLIFREELHNEADGVSEEAFLGYYFSGEHDKEPDEEYRTILDDFLDANDEFEMNFLYKFFLRQNSG